MDKKGQGALEYLLLIGGAVLVAVIVITLLLGIVDDSSDGTKDTVAVANCISRVQIACEDSTTEDIKIACSADSDLAIEDAGDCP